MARKGIREYDAKQLLSRILPEYGTQLILVKPDDNLNKLEEDHPWVKNSKLVVKPDQCFGKRGKHGLIGMDLNIEQTKNWIDQRMNKSVTVGKITDELTHFLIEPFVPHKQEYYVAMRTAFEKDIISLSSEGGVCIEENWNTVAEIDIPEGTHLNLDVLKSRISEIFAVEDRDIVFNFVKDMYKFFCKEHFTYFEINPFAVVDKKIIPLDTVLKVDDTASFECRGSWGNIKSPVPFGRTFTEEEAFIEEIDSKTGASLKLSVLRPNARIWTMVAGGGASVIFADTVSDLGFGHELANYGEYSGNPTKEATYLYAKTIMDLMTRKKDPENKSKILLIGGGIANFTDVAKTFTGIIQAIREHCDKIKAMNVKIYVRRGGPNYKLGLEQMKALGKELEIPIEVYGPETHMTNIVSMALQ